ncbi:MAG: hypothetical protein ACT4OM_07550 [Actinomycetota bacterium]
MERKARRIEMALEWSEDGRLVIVDGPAGRFRGEGHDLFAALQSLRLALEKRGWLIQINAARQDAWPSRMGRGGGGNRIYLLTRGHHARMEDLVDMLAPIESGRAGTVKEQEVFWREWMNGPRA